MERESYLYLHMQFSLLSPFVFHPIRVPPLAFFEGSLSFSSSLSNSHPLSYTPTSCARTHIHVRAQFIKLFARDLIKSLAHLCVCNKRKYKVVDHNLLYQKLFMETTAVNKKKQRNILLY